MWTAGFALTHANLIMGIRANYVESIIIELTCVVCAGISAKCCFELNDSNSAVATSELTVSSIKSFRG